VWRQQAHRDGQPNRYPNRNPNANCDAATDADDDRHANGDRTSAAATTAGRPTRSSGAAAAPPRLARLACLARFPYIALLGRSLLSHLTRIARIARFARLRGSTPVINKSLTFDATAYSVDAIQRAMYRLSDRLSGDVRGSNGINICVLQLEATDKSEAELLVAEFRKEVLDQTLRERIRNETQEVRNLILALAFSNTGLVSGDDS
jgi:His-Xaa-Ser system protein HxsD